VLLLCCSIFYVLQCSCSYSWLQGGKSTIFSRLLMACEFYELLWSVVIVRVLRGHALRVCSECDQRIRKKINCERWSWIRMTIVSWAVLENVWTRNKLEFKLRISAIKFNFSFCHIQEYINMMLKTWFSNLLTR
jgi:hypothetical protein